MALRHTLLAASFLLSLTAFAKIDPEELAFVCMESVAIGHGSEVLSSQLDSFLLQAHQRDAVSKHRKEIQDRYNGLWQEMGFRERYLGGLFGGDKPKSLRARRFRRILSGLAEKLRSQDAEVDAQHALLETQLDENIAAVLSQTSESEKNLMEAEVDLAIRATDQAIGAIAKFKSDVRTIERDKHNSMFNRFPETLALQNIAFAKSGMRTALSTWPLGLKPLLAQLQRGENNSGSLARVAKAYFAHKLAVVEEAIADPDCDTASIRRRLAAVLVALKSLAIH